MTRALKKPTLDQIKLHEAGKRAGGPAGGRAGEKGNGDTTLVACAGRVAESLRAPANGDPVQVRAFFERTSARAVAAALAAKGDDASDWTAATPRDAKTP